MGSNGGTESMRYYLIAGEASGDLHGSNLMKAIHALDPQAQFRCLGGDLMQEAGGSLLLHYHGMAYMGFIPVIRHLPQIMQNMSRCKADILEWKPDVLILIDYPGFNLDIAKYVHSHTDIPVCYYISPKIWAWKEYRIKALRRDVDALFAILPFEVEYFASKNYRVEYVGNPCVDAIEDFRHSDEGHEPAETFASDHQLSSKPIIAILPGSRKQEIKDNLKIMLEATHSMAAHQVVIAGAPGIEPEYYQRFLPQGQETNVVYGQTYRLLSHAEVAVVTSGTATLETALMHVPQVVCYYTAFGKLIAGLRRMFIKVKYISLVNLCAGREVVTELVADQMTANRLQVHLSEIVVGGKRREQMLADYDELSNIVGGSGASVRAARGIIDIANRK